MTTELNAKYGFDCYMRMVTVHSYNKSYPIIVVPSKSYAKFYTIVAPHIHTSMLYKLPSL